MERKQFAGYRLSRLMLGTVQLGMPYGISNRSGQPGAKEIHAILEAALEGGVNGFDTAAGYGDSEKLLGNALHELGVADRVVVVTKVRALTPQQTADARSARRAIEKSVEDSRRRLRLDCLPMVLFHREEDSVYLETLEDLKSRGWLRYAGVSCGNRPGPAAVLASGGRVAALQIPGNILDHRHRRSGVLQVCAEREVAVFIRSVYLQGLLLMPEEDIPPALKTVVPVRRRLSKVAARAGIGMAELALRYMMSLEGVTSVLVGVETVGQMRDNLELCQRGPLPAEIMTAVDTVVPDLPERIVTPYLWTQDACST